MLQVRGLMREKDYDVFAVSESWLNSTVTNADVEIDGYKLTRLDRLGKSGGGVCVYTRSSLKVKRLKDMSEISESGFHQLWMQIQLKKLRSMLLCVAYRPDYCPLPCFVNNFMDKYTQALTFGKDILVAGELVCDMLKPRSPEANALLDLCNSVNLTQLIKEPTRVTENASTLIDVIMTSSNNIVEDSGVVVSHISDHFLVYTYLKLKLPKSLSSSVNIRSYKNYNRDKFVEDLKQVSWHETALVDDVSKMLDHFNTNFLNVLESHAPIKTVRIGPRCCPFVDTK